MKSGIRVISVGITGRVAVTREKDDKNTSGGRGLTDLERELILAKESHAEALVHVVGMQFDEGSRPARTFEVHPDGTVREVTGKGRGECDENCWTIAGPTFHFEAKVIDVESAEVVAVINLSRSTVDELDGVRVNGDVAGGRFYVRGEPDGDTPALRQRTMDAVLDGLGPLIVKAFKS